VRTFAKFFNKLSSADTRYSPKGKFSTSKSTMLIVMNRRALPDEIRLKGWRLPIIVITAVFFIALSLFLLYQIITAPGSLA
jgi:hypothetical protein